jgi:hypothetical protein
MGLTKFGLHLFSKCTGAPERCGRTVFAPSNTGIPLETWMSMCVYSLCGYRLTPVEGVLPTIYRSRN